MTNHPLRLWRLKNGLTLAELAASIGVNKSTVCSYEIRRRVPRALILARIEAVTLRRVTASDFLPDCVNPIPGVSPRTEEAPGSASFVPENDDGTSAPAASPKRAGAETIRRGAA